MNRKKNIFVIGMEEMIQDEVNQLVIYLKETAQVNQQKYLYKTYWCCHAQPKRNVSSGHSIYISLFYICTFSRLLMK